MKRHSRKQLAEAAVTLFEKHSQKEVAQALAQLIIQEKRTNDVDNIVREIGRHLLENQGYLDCTIKSAHPLNKEIREEISKLLKQITQAKTVSLQEETDQRLLGGFKVTTPTVEIDGTLLRPLHHLKAQVS